MLQYDNNNSTQEYSGFANRLISPCLLAEEESRVRARLLLFVLWGSSVVYVALHLALFSIITLPQGEIFVGHWVLLPPLLLYIYCMQALRYATSIQLLGNIVHAVSFVMIPVGILFSGGWERSPLSILLLIIPVLAFALSGLRSGLWWSGVTLASAVLLYIIDTSGWLQLPSLLPEGDWVRLLVELGVVANLMAGLLAYEHLKSSLRRGLRREAQLLQRLAHRDDLTQLMNRAAFEKAATGLIDRSVPFALLFIDLNDFKLVNDRYGHAAGDALLVDVARRLAQAVRAMDISARIGGDEFVVLLDGVGSPEAASAVAEKLSDVALKGMSYRGQTLQISCSVGVVLYPYHGETLPELMSRAGSAMYQAKRRGGGYSLADFFSTPEELKSPKRGLYDGN